MPILVNDFGIDVGSVISLNELHSLKQFSPIEVTDDGIDISINDEHPKKELSSIVVTDDEIDIFCNVEQFLNKFSGIYFISPSIFNSTIPSNILSP